MTRRFVTTLTMAIACATAVAAHHSLGATYDESKKLTLEGKIVQVLLRNPHSFLHVEAKEKDGTLQRWSLEWRGIGQLDAQGITRETLKGGDEVIITMNPSRTAADHRGVLVSLHRKSDGFGWGDKPGEVVD